MNWRMIAQEQSQQEESNNSLGELMDIDKENELLSDHFPLKIGEEKKIDSEEDSSDGDKQQSMFSEIDDRQLQIQLEQTYHPNDKDPINCPKIEKHGQQPYLMEKHSDSDNNNNNFKQSKYLQAGKQINQIQSNLSEQPMPRFQEWRRISTEQAQLKIMERHEKMLRLTTQFFDMFYNRHRQHQLWLQKQQKIARQRERAFEQNKKKIQEMAKKKKAEREMGFFQVVKNWFIGKKQEQSQPQ